MSRKEMQHNAIQRDYRRVVGAGLVALDVSLRDERTCAWSALGGSAGNVLAILAYLGWSSVPVAHLGMDPAAARILREFEALRADTRFLVGDPLTCTPVVYQFQGEHDRTHRFSFACPFCGQKRGFACDHTDSVSTPVLRDVQSSDVFYFDRVTPAALRLAEGYRARGALVMFEPSVVGDDAEDFSRAVRASHILKYADDRIKELAAFDLSQVAIEIQTLGARGLRFRAPSLVDAWLTLPAFDVPRIADTAGAGDWCSAGMLHTLFAGRAAITIEDLSHNRLFEALRFGQALAALNCMHDGARGLARRWSAARVIRTARALQKSPASFAPAGTGQPKSSKLFEWPPANKATAKASIAVESPRLCCEPLWI